MNFNTKEILFEFDGVPIIFISENEKQELFLGMTIEIRYEFNVLLAKINLEQINKIKNKELDFYSIYEKSDKIYLKTIKDGKTFLKEITFHQIPKEFLPEKAVYLEQF